MPRKGETNNPAGRPKGTPNKITGELRISIKMFLEKKWPKIEANFNKLEPYQQVQFFEKLMPYVVPRLRESDLKIDFTKLSDQELTKVVESLFNLSDNE